MIVKKIVTKAYNAEIWPKEAWTAPVKELIDSRKRRGLSTREFESCFCCGRKFEESEIPRVGTVRGVGNRMFCDSCADSD